MSMYDIFQDPKINEQLSNKGYAVMPALDFHEIELLKKLYNDMPDNVSKGTHVTMFAPSADYRRSIDQDIKKICAEKICDLMKDYRVLYTNFMIKEVGPEGDFPVHQDWTYINESKHVSVAFWIPLHDVDETNGALHVVPGSHKFITRLRGPYVQEPFQHLSAEIKSKYAVAMPLKAGEAMIWDHQLIHYSLPNQTPSPRMVITLIMVPEDAEILHCYGQPESNGTIVEKYKIDTDFFMSYTIGAKPEGVPLIETITQPAITFSETEFNEMYQKINADFKAHSQKVAAYYDEYQHGYNDVYGDMIQAFRPTNTDDLMAALVSGADIHDEQQILDAGCGIGGPAIWLAKKYNTHIDGVTISDVQVTQAHENIVKASLSEKVNIIQGDYHELEKYYPEKTFDRVLFLESLGHAATPHLAISGAWHVLKPGGSIYIKDFYYKEPNDSYWRGRVEKTIANIDKYYSYNTLNLTDTIQALRAEGFEIDFIRKFAFKDDISIRFEFEKRFGIDIFGGDSEFAPAEWLEIRCTKPWA